VIDHGECSSVSVVGFVSSEVGVVWIEAALPRWFLQSYVHITSSFYQTTP